MKRITIRELAQYLNLSTSTISRALNDHPDISEATKTRVREAAQAFNYRANLQARSFRKRHSGLIALVTPEINMFHTPALVQGINEALQDSDYSLIVFQSKDNTLLERKLISQCINWAVEGVLISLANTTQDISHLLELEQAGIHCILLDKVIPQERLSRVTIDSRKAGFAAAAHLLGKGHKEILGIFGNPNLQITRDRIAGFRQAHQKAGIDLQEENLLVLEDARQLTYLLKYVLKSQPNVSAVFTMSDELLLLTFSALQQAGIRIPDELSLISISDGLLPERLYPKITHVRDSGKLMGQQAIQLLMAQLMRPNQAATHLLLPTPLVEHGSSGTRHPHGRAKNSNE